MSGRTIDAVSLGAGVLFLSIAFLWLAAQAASLSGTTVSWVLAAGLAGLGVAGLAGSVRGLLRRRAANPDR